MNTINFWKFGRVAERHERGCGGEDKPVSCGHLCEGVATSSRAAAPGATGKSSFAHTLRDLEDKCVTRRKELHRLQEFLFYFHGEHRRMGGWTKAVQPKNKF